MRVPLMHPYQRSALVAWRPSPFAERLLAGFVGLPLLIWLLQASVGNAWLAHAVFASFAAWTANELARVTLPYMDLRQPAAWITGGIYVAGLSGVVPDPLMPVAFGLIAAACYAALRSAPLPERIGAVEKLCSTIMLAALPWMAIGGLYALNPTPIMLFLALAIAWAGDAGDAVFGRLFGKHRLAPALAPMRTWEGAILGATCAVVAALLLKRGGPLAEAPADFLVFTAILGSAGSQAGTLLTGLYRRARGLRDLGTEEPPRQWFIARLESLIFSAPTVWLMATLYSLGRGP